MNWFRIQSVDTILGDFHKIKAKLEAHAETKGKEAGYLHGAADAYRRAGDDALTERGRALTAAQKIGDLTA